MVLALITYSKRAPFYNALTSTDYVYKVGLFVSLTQNPHGRGAVNRDLLDETASGLLYILVKRTRTSQKIKMTSGSMVRTKYKPVLNKAGDRCCPIPTDESNLSGRFEGPRKKDPAAINSPKHMRQRWRT